MTISYKLRKNNIVTDEDVYAGMLSQTASVGLKELADRIIDQGSTVTKPDVLAVLENCATAIESFLLEGTRVQFAGLCDLFPRIKGKFTGPDDSFDPARHKIDLSAVPGARIRKTFRERATVAKKEAQEIVPSLTSFFDLGSNTTNARISTGNIGQINGYRLKFNPEAADEGIFLTNLSIGGTEKITAVSHNTAGKLVFLTPATLEMTDVYQLEVRTRYTTGGTLRTGKLTAQLQPV